MRIHIEDLKFQSIIGILDFERVTPQDVILTIEIDYDYTDTFINYAQVVDFSTSIIIEKQFELIEDALSTLSKSLKRKFQNINTLSIKITKPSILPTCKVSVSNHYIFNS